MSYRPGTIKKEFTIDHPRPRHIEDPVLMTMAADITKDLKEEVERALLEEEGALSEKKR